MPNFAAHILQSLSRHSQKELLRWPMNGQTDVYTGARLLNEISRFRSGLAALNLPAQSPCLLLQPPSPKLLAAMIALMAEGHLVVLPPVGAGVSFVRGFRAAHPTALVLLLDGAKWSLRWLLPLLGIKVERLTQDSVLPTAFTNEVNAVALPTDAVALLSHSSGSTGFPKPIPRSHALLLAQHQCISANFPVFEGQKDLSLFPNVLLHQLAVGCCSVIPVIPDWQLKKLIPKQLLQQIATEQVNSLTANPYFFERLLQVAEKQTFPLLQAVGIGGAPVGENLLEAIQALFPNAKVYVIYGATEVEPIAIRLYEGIDAVFGGYAVGKPVEGLALRLSNRKPLLVAGNSVEAGEIEVQGKHVLGAPNSWHPTGDFGYLQHGQLYLTGRKGNEQIIGYVQHYVIEKAIQHMCDVQKVAAIAKDNAFTLYYTGEAKAVTIRAFLKVHFKQVPIGPILQLKKMPLDKRHHSKILYNKLLHGN